MAWLKLNVGGEMFETTRETLTKFPDSQLAKMVESLKDEEVLRLDLDPEYFRPVLNWLRLEFAADLLEITNKMNCSGKICWLPLLISISSFCSRFPLTWVWITSPARSRR